MSRFGDPGYARELVDAFRDAGHYATIRENDLALWVWPHGVNSRRAAEGVSPRAVVHLPDDVTGADFLWITDDLINGVDPVTVTALNWPAYPFVCDAGASPAELAAEVSGTLSPFEPRERAIMHARGHLVAGR